MTIYIIREVFEHTIDLDEETDAAEVADNFEGGHCEGVSTDAGQVVNVFEEGESEFPIDWFADLIDEASRGDIDIALKRCRERSKNLALPASTRTTFANLAGFFKNERKRYAP